VVLEHLNFINKVISELLAIDVKIDEEDKTLILLSSLPQLDNHIVTTMFYGKKTLILTEVTSTLLSNDIRKKPIQEEQEGSGLVIARRKRRGEGKKGRGSSKACYFYHMEGHWKNDCKNRQEWLKKKRQAAEVR